MRIHILSVTQGSKEENTCHENLVSPMLSVSPVVPTFSVALLTLVITGRYCGLSFNTGDALLS